MHWQVVATGWNHKVLVWQDEEADTVSEYRMFSGHRCAHHHVLPFTLVTDSHNFDFCPDAQIRSHELFLECVLLFIIFIVSLLFSKLRTVIANLATLCILLHEMQG